MNTEIEKLAAETRQKLLDLLTRAVPASSEEFLTECKAAIEKAIQPSFKGLGKALSDEEVAEIFGKQSADTKRHLFSVGWNKGEMDFAILGSVCELSVEQMNQLRQMIVVGIGTMEDMWRREQERKHPAAAMKREGK